MGEMNINEIKEALIPTAAGYGIEAYPGELPLRDTARALLLAIDALQESGDANSKYSKQYYRNRAAMALRDIEEVFQ